MFTNDHIEFPGAHLGNKVTWGTLGAYTELFTLNV